MKRTVLVVSTLLLGAVLFGCAQGAHPQRSSHENDGLTWERAKELTQNREREIVAMFPGGELEAVEQDPEGVLLSCDTTTYNWNGVTNVSLTGHTPVAKLIREVGRQCEAHDWEVLTIPSPLGRSRIQLIAPDGVENYIVAEGEPGVIRIASGSPCFALPEGTYPGGTW